MLVLGLVLVLGFGFTPKGLSVIIRHLRVSVRVSVRVRVRVSVRVSVRVRVTSCV